MNAHNIEDQTQKLPPPRPKSAMQKTSLVFAYISFILAGVSGIFLFLKVQELGASDPVTASFLASFFFCIFSGICLFIMGTANLPNLKFDDVDRDVD